MTGHPLIDDVLAELREALSGGRGWRARVLAEAEDHLLCAVAEFVGAGRSRVEAERLAVARFGPMAEVAAAHLHGPATRSTLGAAWSSLVVAVVFAALFVATTQVAAVRVGVPAHAIADGAAGVATWIAVQIAFVCACVTLVRAAVLLGAARRAGSPHGAAALRLALRGAGTILGVVVASLALDLNGFRMMPAGEGQHAALVFGLWLAASGLSLVAAVLAWRAHRRICALARLDDAAGAVAAGAAPDVVGLAVAWLGARLRLRAWPLAGGAAVSVGLAAGLAHLLAEGSSTRGVALTAAALLLIAAIEGALVVASYAVLGGFLGLRLPAVDGPRSAA